MPEITSITTLSPTRGPFRATAKVQQQLKIDPRPELKKNSGDRTAKAMPVPSPSSKAFRRCGAGFQGAGRGGTGPNGLYEIMTWPNHRHVQAALRHCGEDRISHKPLGPIERVARRYMIRANRKKTQQPLEDGSSANHGNNVSYYYLRKDSDVRRVSILLEAAESSPSSIRRQLRTRLIRSRISTSNLWQLGER